jgi:hypothetical protein
MPRWPRGASRLLSRLARACRGEPLDTLDGFLELDLDTV